jgi:hypothetical protein
MGGNDRPFHAYFNLPLRQRFASAAPAQVHNGQSAS